MWSHEEIASILTDTLPGDKTTAELFSHHYGVEPQGNVSPVKVGIDLAVLSIRGFKCLCNQTLCSKLTRLLIILLYVLTKSNRMLRG